MSQVAAYQCSMLPTTIRSSLPNSTAGLTLSGVAKSLPRLTFARLPRYGMEAKVDVLTLTAAQLQRLLTNKVLSSVDAAKLYLAQIGPAGFSAGSAVAVAAGFAPVSLGTELDCSIVMPAARAGVYAIKLTPESVDYDGFQPGAHGLDSQGPYAKTVTDFATLSAIMQLHDPGHYHPLTTSWDGRKVGSFDPALWWSYPTAIEPVGGFFDQTYNALFVAQAKIEASGGRVARSVPIASWEDITSAMPDFREMEEIFPFQMRQRFPKFLQLFEGVPQTLEELIKFNQDHADLEFTQRNNNQKGLEAGRDTTITQEQYDRNSKALREAASHTLLNIMSEYGVGVLLGPCDSRFATVGAAAGFPVDNLPLGFADFNGRPFSLHALAPASEEAKIFQAMCTWEVSFPDNVHPPPLLIDPLPVRG